MDKLKRLAELIVGHWRQTLSLEEKRELASCLDRRPEFRVFLQEDYKPELFENVLRDLQQLDDRAGRERLLDRIDRK